MCLNSDKNKDMQVVMGGLSMDLDEPTMQTLQVEEAIAHENYRETSASVHNDIGDPRLTLILYKMSTNITNNIRI